MTGPHRILPMGERALLVEVADLAAAMSLHTRLAASPPPGVVDLVPAARTVLVVFDPDRVSVARVRDVIAEAAASDVVPVVAAATVELPVVYDGEDLHDLARLLGLSAETLAARHAATLWTVAFTGFAPGFGYLAGEGWDLVVPRRPTPRTRVRAGAVGLAGEFCGAYPRETPGGWQLIGTTTATLFDPDAAAPALLAPATRVRFIPTRDSARAASPGGDSARAVPLGDGARARPDRRLRIAAAGLLTTVQDAGRPGRAAEGIAVSGAVDRDAAALANRLVGNRPDAAVLEVTLGGLRAVAETPLEVVATGAWGPLSIDGRPIDPYVATPWPAGGELVVGWFERGARATIAVRGGISVPDAVGSRSTDTLSGLGPAVVADGDVLSVGDAVAAPVPALPLHPWGPPPAGSLSIPLVPGPRADWFTHEAQALLYDAVWRVSERSDRVGMRLDGPVLERARADELPSEGMVPGAVQVPPSGSPVVLGVDGPVTGGYPVIGVVTRAGAALLAQAPPGTRLRFVRVAR